MAEINIDLSEVSDEDVDRAQSNTGSWRAIPDGDYPFVCHHSDYLPTKKGDGMVLELRFDCLDPRYNHVRLRDWLTLEHPNPKTVQIAHAKLKALALAVGHPNPDKIKRSEELHGVPVTCHVARVEAEDPRFGDAEGFQNRITSYKPRNGNDTPQDPGVELDEEAPPHDDDDQPPF